MSAADQLERLKLLDEGTLLFNNRPRDGLNFLTSHEIIPDDPADVARFLATTPNLDKSAVGEYLGNNNEQSLAVLNKFAEQFNYQDIEID